MENPADNQPDKNNPINAPQSVPEIKSNQNLPDQVTPDLLKSAITVESINNEKKADEKSKTKKSPLVLTIVILLIIVNMTLFIFLFFAIRNRPDIIGSILNKNTPIPEPKSIINSITPTPSLNPTGIPVSGSLKSSTGLTKSINNFGMTLLKSLAPANLNSNIIISPTSLYLALSSIHGGSVGQTKSELSSALKLTSVDEINLATYSADIIGNFKQFDRQITFNYGISMWLPKDVTASETYLLSSKNYYDSHIQLVDFTDPNLPNIINNWINTASKNQINKIKTGNLDQSSKINLISFAYFDGTWTYEFNPKYTQNRDFSLTGGSKIQVPLMRLTRENMAFKETNAYQSIALPYGPQKRLAMYIILPKNSLASFINDLSEENLNSWTSDFSNSQGTLLLPKFKAGFESGFKTNLLGMGLNTVFSTQADFSNISENLHLNEIFGKAVINVNEEGIEPQSANVVFTPSSMTDPTKFYMEVNRPFIFTIIDTITGQILYIAIIVDPLQLPD